MKTAPTESTRQARHVAQNARVGQHTTLPLLPMTPLLKEKVWGGRRLRRPEGESAAPIGESWQAADLDEGVSTVSSGRFTGATLRELVERFGAQLVGTKAPPGRFPFLVKVIDTDDRLSVQVHPGPEQAQSMPGARSKEESWYFLADGGSVLHGLKTATNRDRFESVLAAGHVTELLREVPVRQGDLLHVAPGTIHAIGAGVLLLEVQEPSDTTFRVWDYGRNGLDGKHRPLHVEEALRVSTFEPAQPHAPHREMHALAPKVHGAVLVDTDCYRMEEIKIGAECTWRLSLSGETCVLATLVEGKANFRTTEQPPYAPTALESVLFPASMGYVDISASLDTTIVLVAIGGHPIAFANVGE